MLIEKKINDHLSGTEKVELFMHTSVCSACRKYEKQSKFIHDALNHDTSNRPGDTPADLEEKIIKRLDKS